MKKSKVRLYDLARELKVGIKRLIEDVRSEGHQVSVPSNAISKELADKIRHKYFPKQSTPSKATVKLIYKPFRGPLPTGKNLERKTSTTRHLKKRICPVCEILFLPCQATAALDNVKGIASQMGCKIRNGSDYVPPMLVKELLRRISFSESIKRNSDENQSQASHPVSKDTVSRSASKLMPDLHDRLQRKDFGELRRLIDNCLKGRPVGKNNESLVTTDAQILLEYARILESKLPQSQAASFRHRIVARIIGDIGTYEKRAIGSRRRK